jgi:hypothetical protein
MKHSVVKSQQELTFSDGKMAVKHREECSSAVISLMHLIICISII